MMGLLLNRRPNAKTGRNRAVKPILEGLEDRMLLYAVNGDVFNFGSRMTFSYMPDGTNLGGIPSNFFGTMNAKFGAGAWEAAIDDAFAQWENITNVNFTQILDNGSALGSGNYQQDSPVVGDIRIGGMALPSNVLALTFLPPPTNGGSQAGDILFNTNQPWNIGNNIDLETVAVHEIGHDVGLGESTNVNAVMYPYYAGSEITPNTDDIAGADSIWGPRQYDAFVQNFNNLTEANAASINNFENTSTDQVYLPGLSITNSSEAEWFQVTTPANASNVLTAQVQSSNLSELNARVQIYSASGVGLAQTSSPANSFGSTIAATITNATPNTTYLIKVLGSTGSELGTGAYAMTVNMGTQAIAIAPPPNTTVMDQPDSTSGPTQLMSVGGVGSAIKQVALAAKNTGPLSLSLQADPSLPAKLDTHAAKVATSGALTNSATETTLDDNLMAATSKSKFTKHPVPQIAVSHPDHRSPAKHAKAHTSKK
jgi:Matrixin